MSEPTAPAPEVELHMALLRLAKGMCGAYERYLNRKYGFTEHTWYQQLRRAELLTETFQRESARPPQP